MGNLRITFLDFREQSLTKRATEELAYQRATHTYPIVVARALRRRRGQRLI